MHNLEIKRLAADLGADLCGVASVESGFENAPEGFHPRDVLPSCRSVVVLARRFLAGTLKCGSTVPYTITRNLLSAELDRLSLALCHQLEDQGLTSVPVGAIDPTLFDAKTRRFRNAVSVKHCAVAAGLGRIGKNTLVVTPNYGNMVWLTAVLTEAELEPDPRLEGDPCPEGCELCLKNCPVQAIKPDGFEQLTCHGHAFRVNQGENFYFKCHLCRSLCPNRFGRRNRPEAT